MQTTVVQKTCTNSPISGAFVALNEQTLTNCFGRVCRDDDDLTVLTVQKNTFKKVKFEHNVSQQTSTFPLEAKLCVSVTCPAAL